MNIYFSLRYSLFLKFYLRINIRTVMFFMYLIIWSISVGSIYLFDRAAELEQVDKVVEELVKLMPEKDFIMM
jgi:hypothetical protein